MQEIIALAKFSDQSSFEAGIRSVLEFKKGKEFRMYKGSLDSTYTDDVIAAKALYGAGPNDARYKMLKLRLKKKLYSNLFFVDYDQLKISRVYQAEFECIKMLYHAHFLSRQYELHLVLQLASKIKRLAGKYEFISLLIDATELELNCYAENGNFKEFKNSRKSLEALLKIKYYEREAQTLYQSIKLDAKKAIKLRRTQLLNINQRLDRLQKLYTKAGSFESFNSYYKASIIYNELMGNFEAIVELTIDAEKKAAEGGINSNRFNSAFNKFELVYSHLRAKKLESGIKYASEYLDGFTEYTPNWYAFLENYFLLALHSKKYELASTLINRALVSSTISKLPASARERWNLYEAYFLLLYRNENMNFAQRNPFLLSLPEYSKDKQGFNVAILILQFVYYLHKQDKEALLYRIESLKKYILTHLKDSFSLRSKIFLKLLILIVTEDFDVTACRKKGNKLYHKLLETPTPGDAYAEIEIVPYEHLWEYILDTLQAQK
ncbi:hypothetical protein [Pontibacter mangrovi]|uniref:Uncharacterized protein n=1 Tax=Pontibacter mangrovi TaxID=2589816 RepID=A0A501W007_9BACT|nr:hypothetical protein [Pontibacter mangrovi]TPE43303.1 hypothetical protein FJM65_14425 [Pontibacter mangrovi]